jgi:anti-sigma factor RsiW
MSASLAESLTEYLLGGLPPEQRAAMEERVFTEGTLEEDLQELADDLITDYLSGALSEGDRRRFEAHFLASARHRQRLAFMRSLLAATDGAARAVEARAAPPRRWLWWSLAAALLLAAGAWLARIERPQPHAPQGAANRPSPSATPSTERLSPEPRQAQATPGGASPEAGEAPRRVSLPAVPARPVRLALGPRTSLVHFEVAMIDDPPGVDVSLVAADGKIVWHADDLEPPEPGQPLRLAVPARTLAAEDYTLSVRSEPERGASPPAARRYLLHVVRER